MSEMKTIKIKKGSPRFLRGLDSLEDINKWWVEHPQSIGIAFVGRSNVGKSSLVNTMFGAKTAKTAKTPGRTQKINVFSFVLENDETNFKFHLYDLPGYGHAKVSKAMGKNWREIMTEFFSHMNETSMLVNIQDARHPDQASDKLFYEYINAENVPIFLTFNKIDKLKTQKERSALNKMKPKIFKDYSSVEQIHFVSAEKKDGVEALETSLITFLRNQLDKVELNLS